MTGHDEDGSNRSQVGIGTLIVFIAMVLVAAIASGVLIDTASVLQTQAETTSEESVAQVSSNVDPISVVGSVYNPGETGNVSKLEIEIMAAPGADTIDLEQLTIQVLLDSETNLIHFTQSESFSDPGGMLTIYGDVSDSGSQIGFFHLEEITAEQTGENILSDRGDRYKIIIPLHSEGLVEATETDPVSGGTTIRYENPQLSDINPGESMRLTLLTAQGTQRELVVRAPRTLVDRDVVKL